MLIWQISMLVCGVGSRQRASLLCYSLLWKFNQNKKQKTNTVYFTFLAHIFIFFSPFERCTHPTPRPQAVWWAPSSGWTCCWVSGPRRGTWECSIWTQELWTFHSEMKKQSQVISNYKAARKYFKQSLYLLPGNVSLNPSPSLFFKPFFIFLQKLWI